MWWLSRALPLGIVLALLPAASVERVPPPIEVRVGESIRLLPPGFSMGQTRRMLNIRPRHGDLLDVEGVVLERNRFRGYILVSGEPADRDRILRDGDVMKVVDERDHFEPVTIDTQSVPVGQVLNPQTQLGTTPGKQIITSGSISGKLVSTAFQATGPSATPPAVALTFDDGPSATYTPRILKILKRFKATATFFTVGYLAERYPDLIRRLLDAGMAVASHSMTHPNSPPFADLPPNRLRQELMGGTQALQKLGGTVKSFRPPGGSWDEVVKSEAQALDQRVVLWSVDTQDWLRPKPKVIAKRVLDNVRPGSIILMHDGGGDRSNTVKALPRILRGLKKMGLGYETL
jgi:peptidoglycan/xylan/chitin deacetylase (PgdA/CDA1 family)